MFCTFRKRNSRHLLGHDFRDWCQAKFFVHNRIALRWLKHQLRLEGGFLDLFRVVPTTIKEVRGPHAPRTSAVGHAGREQEVLLDSAVDKSGEDHVPQTGDRRLAAPTTPLPRAKSAADEVVRRWLSLHDEDMQSPVANARTLRIWRGAKNSRLRFLTLPSIPPADSPRMGPHLAAPTKSKGVAAIHHSYNSSSSYPRVRLVRRMDEEESFQPAHGEEQPFFYPAHPDYYVVRRNMLCTGVGMELVGLQGGLLVWGGGALTICQRVGGTTSWGDGETDNGSRSHGHHPTFIRTT